MIKLHGLLLMVMLREPEWHDQDLVQCFQQGFPYIGMLPQLGYYTRVSHKSAAFMPEHDLLRRRPENNDLVISKLKPSDDDAAVLAKTLEEFNDGYCSKPRPLQPSDLTDLTLARRIGVMEWRDHFMSSDGSAGDCRLRNVDHETESSVNEATSCPQALMMDTIDN